jgi:hypothetical protein
MTPPPGSAPLAGLRGYHLPGPVSWWPPAPGWWVLAILLALAASSMVWLLLRRKRRRAALRVALAELEALSDEHTAIDPDAAARRLSRLLRRYALTRFPRREVAGLTGDDWLRFLDDTGGEQAFSRGPGRLLREAPYRTDSDADALRELAALARAWIRHNSGAIS